MLLVDAMGAVVALTAAVRSMWSPCGLSMLSSITPLGERGRGNRFRHTAAWFIVGAIAGGLCLGGGGALLALAWGALGTPQAAALATGGALAALAALADLGALGFEMPLLRRQVNERWLDQFRGWVYGAGFGWQIGVGLATYVMTTGVLLVVALGALGANPLVALGEGALFGTVRGLAVLIGALATTPAALMRIHQRVDRFREPVRRSTIGVLAAVALVLAGVWWPLSLVVALPVGACAALWGTTRLSLRRHRARVVARP
jgi:MFS family permease